MKASAAVVLMLLLALFAAFPPAIAEDAEKEPVHYEMIQQLLVDGVKYLYSQQMEDDLWKYSGTSHPVGTTALVLYALGLSGISPRDEKYKKGFAAFEKALSQASMDTLTTYDIGLAIILYEFLDRRKHEDKINRLKGTLLERQAKSGGWDYNKPSYMTTGKTQTQRTDWSNTQFGVLGMANAEYASERGYVYRNRRPPEHWLRLRDYILFTRTADRGWPYCPTDQNAANATSVSLTAAGIASALLTFAALNHTNKFPCGTDKDLMKAIDDGIGYYASTPSRIMSEKPPVKAAAWMTYKMYAIERVGFYSGLRRIGDFDWFNEGARLLVESAKDKEKGGWGDVPGAAFALMYLSKGRWPIIVQKLKYGTGWNNDPLDMLRLTEKASEVFESGEIPVETSETVYMPTPTPGKHCTWVTLTPDSELEEWFDVPLLYFNGHDFPKFDDDTKKKLRKYAFGGGIILAVSCCGEKAFDKGLREYAADAFEGWPLAPLERTHPMFTSQYRSSAAYAPIEAVIGPSGRPMLLYISEGVSCDWEGGHIESKEAKLGISILKYVADLVPGFWK